MGRNSSLFRCIKDGECVKFSLPWSNPIEFIIKWARARATSCAIIADVEGIRKKITRTWADLVKRVLVASSELEKFRNDRFAIIAGSHPTTIEAVCACLLCGIQFTLIDFLRSPQSHHWFRLDNFRPNGVIIPPIDEMSDQLFQKVEELKKTYSELKIFSFGDNPIADVNLVTDKINFKEPPKINYKPGRWVSPSVIIYSSGKYHRYPTGYAFHPRSIIANAIAVADRFKMNSRTRFLLATNIDSCDGLIPVLSTMVKGGTVLICSKLSADKFWEKVCILDPTLARTTSALIDLLVTFEGKFRSFSKGNLKHIVVGSGFLPKQLGLRFLDTFDIPLVQSYGTTATGGYVFAMEVGKSKRIYEIALRDNIVGEELGYCNTKLGKEGITSAPTPVPEGGFGRVFVRGKSVSCGYWNGSKVIYWDCDWIETADVVAKVKLQDKVQYQLYGRLENALQINGNLIWPMYIEQLLVNTFDFLAECVVLAISRRGRRKKLVAVVSFNLSVPEYQHREYLTIIQTRINNGGVVGLDKRFVPQDIVLMDYNSIPRTFDGKPDRKRLSEQILQFISNRRARA